MERRPCYIFCTHIMVPHFKFLTSTQIYPHSGALSSKVWTDLQACDAIKQILDLGFRNHLKLGHGLSGCKTGARATSFVFLRHEIPQCMFMRVLLSMQDPNQILKSWNLPL